MPAKQKTKHKRRSKAKKVENKKFSAHGWDTTDQDEIERRKFRAQSEDIVVEKLGNSKNLYYNSFLVYSRNLANHNLTKYLVEIRSLNELKNSCNCLDFQTNKIGTCKHIERVLLKLQKPGKKKFKKAALQGSPQIEIYLATNGNDEQNAIKIEWPQNISTTSKTYRTISKLFSVNNSLIGDPLKLFPKLKNIIQQLNTNIKKKIRLSAHVNDWFDKLKTAKQRQTFSTTFKVDVNAGKYNLDMLKHSLYPYQQQGTLHLALNERALLADDMGLGKTVQAIAACKLLCQTKNIKRVLVVATASLKAEWEEQIAKFSDLKTLIIQGPRSERLKLYQTPAFFYLTNYEQIRYDGAEIQRLIMPDVIILDEAQRIKNWQTKTAKAVKKLSSPYAFVLTGTPIENRIDDVYSIVQFLNPYLFGALFQFNRQFYCLDEKGKPVGYKNLDKLHRKLRTILLRRKKTDVEDQLPERTVNNYFVEMHEEQQTRYEEYSTRVAKLLYIARKRPLRKEELEMLQKWLACMRMLCDTPYILDQECRISPKLHELEKILEELLENQQTKILIFSEWERMLQLIKELAQEMKLEYAWHTGSVPQHKRRLEINRFKTDPKCRLFLSTDSGSVGLNLQAANIVINMDLPWNPAKLEQRIARAWRKYQKNTVQVINLVCEDSIEHRMLGLLEQKKALADNVLHDGKIKEMKMPSGRAAFMERLEALMNIPKETFLAKQAKEKIEKPHDSFLEQQSLQQFTTDVLSYCQDNLITLQKHQNSQGKSILFAVTKDNDQHTREHIQQNLQIKKLNQSHELVTLDKKTQDTLNHLAELGIITINKPAEQLFESASTTETRKKQQNIRLQNARKHLSKVERKYSMAKLLADGGFYQEAVAPIIDSIRTALTAFAYANHKLQDLKNYEISISQLVEPLREHTDFPQQLLDNALIIQSSNKPINDSQLKNFLTTANSIIEFIGEAFNKLALI